MSESVSEKGKKKTRVSKKPPRARVKKRGGKSIVSSIAAAVCILIYLSALAYGLVQMYRSIRERQAIAVQEFEAFCNDANSAAGTLGYSSDAYNEALYEALLSSRTIDAVIINDPDGDRLFERSPGAVIEVEDGIPRFKNVLGYPRAPFVRSLNIEGRRNIRIQSVYNSVDYEYLTQTLRIVLVIVLGGLSLGFLTLIIESLVKKNAAPRAGMEADTPAPLDDGDLFDVGADAAGASKPETEAGADDEVSNADVTNDAVPGDEVTDDKVTGDEVTNDDSELDQGDEEGGITAEMPPPPDPDLETRHETDIRTRLNEELHRCAALEQDLSFIIFELKAAPDAGLSRAFISDAAAFFGGAKRVFERGGYSLAIILPNTALEEGMARADAFYRRTKTRLLDTIEEGADLYAGLSSRNSRLVNAERLMLESQAALDKALADPVSRIIAFKSDPSKYREYLNRE
ncbi:MAG: hypothetical protein LBR16_01760 [Treponema sp.]|jgi:hypothetical protein|nr:hypothetical protein [Treponema sp.]